MTTNVKNSGIAHLGYRLGGPALCGNRKAHVTVTVQNQMGCAICRRCLGKIKPKKAQEQALQRAQDALANPFLCL